MSERFDYASTPIRDDCALIEASAGTGKTYALTGLVLRMVLEGRVSELKRLLVVTFTVAATDELKTRIRRALRETLRVLEGGALVDTSVAGLVEDCEAWYERQQPAVQDEARRRLRRALEHVDDASIFTIHGFCKRVLEQAAFESGSAFDPAFLEEADELLERAASDFWHRMTYADPLLASLAVQNDWAVDTFVSHYKATRRHPETMVVPEGELLEDVRAAIEEATDALREQWDREALNEALATVQKWNKNAPLGTRREEVFGGIEQFLDGAFHDGMAAVYECTTDAVSGSLYKRGKANKAIAEEVSQHSAFQACSRVADALGQVEWALLHAFIREVGEAFEQAKRDEQVMTFDDLLHHVWEALRDEQRGPALAASIRDRFEVALVDEFQDTDPFQYEIFRRAFAGCSIYYIGDPKQAIYSFRGADLFTYLEAQGEADRKFALGKNWRSSERLIAAINALFEPLPRPFVYDSIGYEPVEAAGRADETPLSGDDQSPLVWWHLPTDGLAERGPINKPVAEDALLEAVQQEVMHLLTGPLRLGDERVQPKNIAVLVRENAQAARVQEVLNAVGIASVVSRSGDVLESQELQDIELILKAVAEPSDASAVRAALTTELWSGTADRLLQVSEDDEAWSHLTATLGNWKTLWRDRGVARLLHEMVAERKVDMNQLQFRGGERCVTNLRHCIELLHDVEESRQLGPEGLLRWLRRRQDETVEREHRELRLESDDEAVQIVTVHSSKGLEYDIVLCPFLWDAKRITRKKNPLVHIGDGVVYDAGSDRLDHHIALAETERVAEDVRLAYVAMTRAKHRCYLAWGDVNQANYSALAYILYGRHVDDAGEPEDVVKAMSAYVKNEVSDTRTVLDAFAEAHPELVSVRDVREVQEQAVTRYSGDGAANGELSARAVPERFYQQLQPWTVGSFSRWTDGAVEVTTRVHRADDEAGLFAFAAGSTAGTCLHEILRYVDFTDVASEETEKIAARMLERFGLDEPESHHQPIDPHEAVRRMLSDLVTAPLPSAGFSLQEVSQQVRLNEWAFAMSVGGLDPLELKRAFADFGNGAIRSEYARRLATVEQATTDAFVRGTADLVFKHAGQWYLIDWKSNHLGSSPAHYDRDAMEQTMFEHHYTLQYHLYTVALHRYLKTRLPDYDYDQHFGGVWYVFLRGVTDTGDTGFYYDRPSQALVEALSEQLTSQEAVSYA